MAQQRLDFLDCSHYQGGVNWAEVQADGQVLAAICKATEGTSFVDARFAENRADCSAVGLAFASYHYLHHGNVDAQMRFYMDIADPEPGSRVVIDYEDNACGIDDLLQAVETLRVIRPDVEITVYGASKLTEDAAGYNGTLAGTSLWAARYSNSPPKIATEVWPYWSAWQYSDKGSVPGIDGAVDLNTFNGSRDACLEWFGQPVAVQPLPEPEPPFPPLVVIDIVVPDGVSIEVSVNGLIMAHSESLS